MKKIPSFFLSFLLLIFWGCRSDSDEKTNFISIFPEYADINLVATSDTLRFPLSEHSTTAVTSVNYFSQNGKEYLSTYDRVSKLINIYSFPDGRIVKTILLKDWLTGTNLDKASIFIQNFDTIIVCTRERIVLFDSTSLIKKKFEIERKKPIRIPDMENETPPVFKNHILFTQIVPAIDERSLPEHRRWKLLFGFDLNGEQPKMYYNFPETYHKNLYGYSFLNYSYCINDKGNFVFSFPADTNIYETDFADYNNSYLAKSKNQNGEIPPISEEVIDKGFSFREYSLRDSYGAIFFDPQFKRYLRQAKQKMDESSLMAKQRVRKRSIVMLNDHFKIIGEGNLPDSISFNSLFFTKQGEIFGRLAGVKDPFITYIRLVYDQNDNQQTVKSTTKL